MNIEPPELPLDFSPEEIQQAKDVAYAAVLQEYPVLGRKQYRLRLGPTEKLYVVHLLARLFENAVAEIRKTRNAR